MYFVFNTYLKGKIKMKLDNLYDYEKIVINHRRYLHKHPELSFEEYKTHDYIVKTLQEYGIKNIKTVFNTGVVAVIVDESKKCIALRCDIDALPVTEETNLPFRSENIGVMHACAHDGHTAIVLTMAKILKDNEDKLNCCVKLIFQPAEETEGGAEPMIKEGVLLNPDVEEVYGFHLWNNIECGKVCYTKGVSFASASRFEIKIKGKGGHGAMPEKVTNSLIPSAYVINTFDKINKKYENAVVSLCSCNTDGTYNVFCENVVFKGTIRTISEVDYNNIVSDISEIKNEIKEKYSCECNIDIFYEYPTLNNDENVLNKMISSAKKILGEENVFETSLTYAAEDFSFFTVYSKAAHIKIGVSDINKPETCLPLHNPKFDIDEKSLMYAIEILVDVF